MNSYRVAAFGLLAATMAAGFYFAIYRPWGSEPSGVMTVTSCRGLSGVNEGCTLLRDASACVKRRCSRLVITFSGAEMGCRNREGYASSMANYVRHGYAAVCINYFDSFKGSLHAPFIDQASRLDEAVKAVTQSDWAKHYWTGEDLVFEGISHGATAPMILIARTQLAGQAHWRGSRRTGACFFDGSYNQIASADLLGRGDHGQPCHFPLTDAWVLERYCGPGVARAACDLHGNLKVSVDTIVEAPVDYVIRNFKMFECGSALDACVGDILPKEPIETLCRRIAGTAGYTCEYQALPQDGHLVCHGNQSDLCRQWFESLAN